MPDRRARLGIPATTQPALQPGVLVRWDAAPSGHFYGTFVRHGDDLRSGAEGQNSTGYAWVKRPNGEVLVHTGDLQIVSMSDVEAVKEWLHG